MRRYWLYIVGMVCLYAGMVCAQQEPPVAQEPVKVDVVAILDKVKNPFKSLIKKPEIQQPAIGQFYSQPINPMLNEGVNKAGQVINRTIEHAMDKKTVATKPVMVEEKIPNVSIEGIIWSDTIHQAIIDGKVVGIGDKVSDMTIQDINAKGIIVEFHGKQYSIAID